MATTEKKMWLVALKSLEKLEIQFVPYDLKFSRTSNLAEIMIVGRNYPNYQYTNGASKISLVLDFHCEDTSRQDVIRKVKWLEALGTHNDGFANPPEKFKLIWGEMFREERFVIANMNVTYSNFQMPSNLIPHQAIVELDLVQDMDNVTKWADILWQR